MHLGWIETASEGKDWNLGYCGTEREIVGQVDDETAKNDMLSSGCPSSSLYFYGDSLYLQPAESPVEHRGWELKMEKDNAVGTLRSRAERG